MIAKGMSLNDAGFWITEKMKWKINERPEETNQTAVNS